MASGKPAEPQLVLNLSFAAWRGISVTLHIIAISSTIFRLSHRTRLRRLWWDDYMAFIALLIDFAYFSSVFLRRDIGDPKLTRQLGVTVFWMTGILFPTVVWTARLSIAFSIIRLVPERTAMRRLLFCMVVLFVCNWMALLIQKFIQCVGPAKSAWTLKPPYQCFLGDAVGIITLTTDVIADALLIIIPLSMLRAIRIARAKRRLLLAIFSSSLLSTFAGIVYAVFVFKADTFGKKRAILLSLTANIKVCVALTVCNLLVVVTFFYRNFRRGEDLETEAAPPTTKEIHISMTNPNTRTGPHTRFTNSIFNDIPTVDTTSTFDNTPRSTPSQPTMQSSKFGNTTNTTGLAPISEHEPKFDPLSSAAMHSPTSVASSQVASNPHHK